VTTVDPWGRCPECKAEIRAEQAACKGCGFPLKPQNPPPQPAAPPPVSPSRATTRTRKRRRGDKGRPLLEPAEEPPAALMFAFFGLVVPILAFLGLALSHRGSKAYTLSWVGIGLFIATVLFILFMATS
jgi:hypothetical protein